MRGFRPLASASVAAIALAVMLGAPAQAEVQIAGLPAGITAVPKGHGAMFSDAKGMTLYTYDKDEEAPGTSVCKADCAKAWPPLVAPADAKATDGWSIIAREDGTKQWSYKGKPLYTYALDAFPGATFGDGVGTIWWPAFQPIAMPSEVKLGKTLLGDVLTDAKNMTLYTSDSDKPGKSNCDSKCTRTWQPILAPWLGNPMADWTVVTRDDGTKQWAYKGKPLYRYTKDINPSETMGDGAVKGWHAAVLEPAPALPPFVTVRSSDAGQLLADEKGKTLYTRGTTRQRGPVDPKCPADDCPGADWIPVVAVKDAKSMGSWVLVDMADGNKQWSYKGMKLYTNTLDQQPGDFKGIRFGGDRRWSTIMRSGQPMQGVSAGG